MASTLAIHGGAPVRTEKFPAQKTHKREEIEAVTRVIESQKLSHFLAGWGNRFFGGPEVQSFEEEWATKVGAKHAIAVNSCTSGLYAAVGALELGPGDEVIVSPFTMSASAVAPLIYGAIPVFADVEPDLFCLDPASVREKITPRTKAIIPVDIFGQPYDVEAIGAIADEFGLKVIEDCAQAPMSKFGNRFSGTLGDVGVYSLNVHKHIHTGEGGMVVTDDDAIADRIRLIRNHAEAVVEKMGHENLVNMLGFNYRMTEIEAALGRIQLTRLDELVGIRRENSKVLIKGLSGLPGITMPKTRSKCEHSYYMLSCLFDDEIVGVARETFLEAVRAELTEIEGREGEGVLINGGYVKPLYLQPLYQSKIAFGRDGWPWSALPDEQQPSYAEGLCPVAEHLYHRAYFSIDLMRPPCDASDMKDVIDAFHKVYEHRKSLA